MSSRRDRASDKGSERGSYSRDSRADSRDRHGSGRKSDERGRDRDRDYRRSSRSRSPTRRVRSNSRSRSASLSRSASPDRDRDWSRGRGSYSSRGDGGGRSSTGRGSGGSYKEKDRSVAKERGRKSGEGESIARNRTSGGAERWRVDRSSSNSSNGRSGSGSSEEDDKESHSSKFNKRGKDTSRSGGRGDKERSSGGSYKRGKRPDDNDNKMMGDPSTHRHNLDASNDKERASNQQSKQDDRDWDRKGGDGVNDGGGNFGVVAGGGASGSGGGSSGSKPLTRWNADNKNQAKAAVEHIVALDKQQGHTFYVDPLNVKEYRKYVPQPEWLERVQKRVKSSYYKSVEEFVHHVRRVFANALRFNVDPVIRAQAIRLLEEFGSRQPFQTVELVPEWRACLQVLERMHVKDQNPTEQVCKGCFAFPIAVYFPVIPEDYDPKVKRPIDLATITSGLLERGRQETKATNKFSTAAKVIFNCRRIIVNSELFRKGKTDMVSLAMVRHTQEMSQVLVQACREYLPHLVGVAEGKQKPEDVVVPAVSVPQIAGSSQGRHTPVEAGVNQDQHDRASAVLDAPQHSKKKRRHSDGAGGSGSGAAGGGGTAAAGAGSAGGADGGGGGDDIEESEGEWGIDDGGRTGGSGVQAYGLNTTGGGAGAAGGGGGEGSELGLAAGWGAWTGTLPWEVTMAEVPVIQSKAKEAPMWASAKKYPRAVAERLEEEILDFALTARKACDATLTELLKIRIPSLEATCREVFEIPIETIQALPDYMKYVSTPMDLVQARRKMIKGANMDAGSFQADVELTFRNCMAYHNPAGGCPEGVPVYYEAAKLMLKHARQKFRTLQLTLRETLRERLESVLGPYDGVDVVAVQARGRGGGGGGVTPSKGKGRGSGDGKRETGDPMEEGEVGAEGARLLSTKKTKEKAKASATFGDPAGGGVITYNTGNDTVGSTGGGGGDADIMPSAGALGLGGPAVAAVVGRLGAGGTIGKTDDVAAVTPLAQLFASNPVSVPAAGSMMGSPRAAPIPLSMLPTKMGIPSPKTVEDARGMGGSAAAPLPQGRGGMGEGLGGSGMMGVPAGGAASSLPPPSQAVAAQPPSRAVAKPVPPGPPSKPRGSGGGGASSGASRVATTLAAPVPKKRVVLKLPVERPEERPHALLGEVGAEAARPLKRKKVVLDGGDGSGGSGGGGSGSGSGKSGLSGAAGGGGGGGGKLVLRLSKPRTGDDGSNSAALVPAYFEAMPAPVAVAPGDPYEFIRPMVRNKHPWEEECDRLLKAIMKHDLIDPKKQETTAKYCLDVPIMSAFPAISYVYQQLIDEPMDLGSLQKLLNGGRLKNTQDFVNKLLLTFENAIYYNKLNGGDEDDWYAQEIIMACTHLRNYVSWKVLETLELDNGNGGGQPPGAGGGGRGRVNPLAEFTPVRLTEADRDRKRKEREEMLKDVRIVHNASTMKEAKKMISKMTLQTHAGSMQYFMAPVDTRMVPDYEQYVKEPADMGTISYNVENQMYQLYTDFIADLRRIFTNAKTYYGPKKMIDTGHKSVHEAAEVMSLQLEKILGEFYTIDVLDRLGKERLAEKRRQWELDEERRAYRPQRLVPKKKTHDEACLMTKIDGHKRMKREKLELAAATAAAAANEPAAAAVGGGGSAAGGGNVGGRAVGEVVAPPQPPPSPSAVQPRPEKAAAAAAGGGGGELDDGGGGGGGAAAAVGGGGELVGDGGDGGGGRAVDDDGGGGDGAGGDGGNDSGDGTAADHKPTPYLERLQGILGLYELVNDYEGWIASVKTLAGHAPKSANEIRLVITLLNANEALFKGDDKTCVNRLVMQAFAAK